jgi:hypothetical protein
LVNKALDGDGLFGMEGETGGEDVWRIVRSLGKLSERWWTKWSERGTYFSEDGVWIGDESLGRHPRLTYFGGTLLTEDEKLLLDRIYRRMLAYEPTERATAEEVAELIPESWMQASQSVRLHF